jgi:iron complex transport system substrate-binding protein
MTRRPRPRLLPSLLTAAALVTTAACGASDESSSTDATGSWSFTDDRGRTIELDHEPRAIVAQSSIAAALHDSGVEVVGTFGPLEGPDGRVDPQAAGLDPSKVTDVTSEGEYGDLDMEKLAGLAPDLVVTNMYVPPDLWYINKATEKKVDGLTKTLAIDFQDASLTETIDAVGAVAKELGGDPESPDAQQAKADFEAASDRLRKIGDQLGDRQILAASTTPDMFYAGDPTQFPDLAYYQSLGLPIVPVKAEAGSYWDEISWEKADKYAADIVLYDARDGATNLETLKKQPALGQLTAAKEGSYVPWQAVACTGSGAIVDRTSLEGGSSSCA